LLGHDWLRLCSHRRHYTTLLCCQKNVQTRQDSSRLLPTSCEFNFISFRECLRRRHLQPADGILFCFVEAQQAAIQFCKRTRVDNMFHGQYTPPTQLNSTVELRQHWQCVLGFITCLMTYDCCPFQLTPLRVHSATSCQQTPEWSVLGQVFSLCIACICNLSSILYFPRMNQHNSTVYPNCADVPLRIYSLIHSVTLVDCFSS